VNERLLCIINGLPPSSPVLDLGGWFIPLNEATHVVDYMPYETRRGRLSLQPVPGERFSRSTWIQADFLKPDFRLPFADGAFPFVHCGHTLEDLADPVPLLNEILRVSTAGCIRGPTRLTEQTRGVRDRKSSAPGHPHHHWMIDPTGDGLRFCSKADSLRSGDEGILMPLLHYERVAERIGGLVAAEFIFQWKDKFDVEFVRGDRSAAIAREFARDQRVLDADRRWDPLIRRARALKHVIFQSPTALEAPERWWAQMLELSRPYSLIPL
jgi:SAM-dependent methyltransferase